MNFTKGHRKFELIGTVRDHPFDDVGAEPLIVQFLHWENCFDVLRAKPYLVADIVLQGFVSVSIIKSGHVIGCLD